MKKKIAGLLVIAAVIASSAFATNIEDNVNQKVLTSFNQMFNEAQEVSWVTTDKYVKASFKMNEQIMTAFFTETGEFMGVSRNIVSSQLPINLQIELRKQYSNGWITELFEFAGENETNYYLTIENSDQKIMLKSSGTNSWTGYKKTKKEY